MWLFRHVNVMSYKCSVMSTEVAPIGGCLSVEPAPFPDAVLVKDHWPPIWHLSVIFPSFVNFHFWTSCLSMNWVNSLCARTVANLGRELRRKNCNWFSKHEISSSSASICQWATGWGQVLKLFKRNHFSNFFESNPNRSSWQRRGLQGDNFDSSLASGRKCVFDAGFGQNIQNTR